MTLLHGMPLQRFIVMIEVSTGNSFKVPFNWYAKMLMASKVGQKPAFLQVQQQT